MPNISVNKINLYYETHGEGEPLMLIAGLASDSQSWQTILAPLSENFYIIAPDNRCSGRTQSTDMQISIPLMAEDCHALIKNLGLSRVNVLGHSMGGMIALELAKTHPGCLDKLILASTSCNISSRNRSLFLNLADSMLSGMEAALWFKNFFYWLFSRRFFDNETALLEAVRYAVEYPYPQSVGCFVKQVLALVDYDCTEGLSKITAKTMVIIGDQDILFYPEESQRLAQDISDATLCLLQDSAHAIHIEQPLKFSESVIKFLKSEPFTITT